MRGRTSRTWRGALAVVLVTVVGVGVVTSLGREERAQAQSPSLEAYEGLGTWVDVFDYAPRLLPADALPPVTVDSVPDMAAVGVETLFLQVQNPEGSDPRKLTDAVLVRRFLEAAHQEDVRVVAWFLPGLENVDADLALLRAVRDLRVDGKGFDGIGLDIEDTRVEEIKLRNQRLVEFTRRGHALVDDRVPLGAIVYPAVQIEVLNTTLWPDFPYKKVAPYVDVWVPMAYYTFRDGEWRDPYRYANESVRRLRNRLDDDDAQVHIAGGIGDLSTVDDYVALRRVTEAVDGIGYSVYDYRTIFSSAWPYLRGDAG